jgi:hypothetical protein
LDAAKLLRAWSVHEDVEGIRAIPQVIRRTASHNDAVALGSDLSHDALADFDHLIGVERALEIQVGAALVAASPENFNQPIEGAIDTFIAAVGGRSVNFGHTCNLFREFLVPKLPAELRSQFARNFRRAATVLPLDGDDAEHGAGFYQSLSPEPLILDALRRV